MTVPKRKKGPCAGDEAWGHSRLAATLGETVMGASTGGSQSSPGMPEYAEVPLEQIEPDPEFSRWPIDPNTLGDLPQGDEQHGPAAARRRTPCART